MFVFPRLDFRRETSQASSVMAPSLNTTSPRLHRRPPHPVWGDQDGRRSIARSSKRRLADAALTTTSATQAPISNDDELERFRKKQYQEVARNGIMARVKVAKSFQDNAAEGFVHSCKMLRFFIPAVLGGVMMTAAHPLLNPYLAKAWDALHSTTVLIEALGGGVGVLAILGIKKLGARALRAGK
jgi:hypothetical protein